MMITPVLIDDAGHPPPWQRYGTRVNNYNAGIIFNYDKCRREVMTLSII